jgi:hypothetical protein
VELLAKRIELLEIDAARRDEIIAWLDGQRRQLAPPKRRSS